MKIVSTGACVPEKIVKNEEISSSPQWVEENLGLKERRVGRTSVELGTVAAKRAIIKSGVFPDVIIVATATPDKLSPSTACLIAKECGSYVPAFDINAVCSGFLYSLYLAEKIKETVLIIGVDTFSKITDWARRDCVFFGDGAGAVMTIPGDNLKNIVIRSAPENNGFSCDHGGTFQMDGKLVYEYALKLVPEVIEEAMEGFDLKEIDYMVPHQPSTKILHGIADKIGFPREKVLMNLDKYANTSAATIPILLHENWSKFQKGQKILFASIGSGWTYGAAVYEI